MTPGLAEVDAQGVQAAASNLYQISPETYVGYGRAAHFSSPGGVTRDQAAEYSVPTALSADQWALGGRWTVTTEGAVLQQSQGRIVYRFNGRDLHLVLGPTKGHAVHFKVRLDGKDPRGRQGRRHQPGRFGRRHRTAAVPADPAGTSRCRAHRGDPVPGSRRRGLRVYFRVGIGEVSCRTEDHCWGP